jgi:hypothetical protein
MLALWQDGLNVSSIPSKRLDVAVSNIIFITGPNHIDTVESLAGVPIRRSAEGGQRKTPHPVSFKPLPNRPYYSANRAWIALDLL